MGASAYVMQYMGIYIIIDEIDRIIFWGHMRFHGALALKQHTLAHIHIYINHGKANWAHWSDVP